MSGIGSNAGSQGRGAPPYVPWPAPPSVLVPNQSSEGLALVGSPTAKSQGPYLDTGSPSGSATQPTIGSQDNRYEVYITADSLMPSNKVSSTITTIMREHMEVGAYTFVMISQERLMNYWEKFQAKCKWDPALTDQVYQLWYERSSLQYQNMLSSWKKKWDEEETTPCCDTVVWQALLAYWNKQDARRKSKQCRQNRHSEPAGPGTDINGRCGGSCGAGEVAPWIERETGLPAQEWEVVPKHHVYLDEHKMEETDVQLRVGHLSQAVEWPSDSLSTWDMPHCGRLSKMRHISELISTASSPRLYSQEEVDYLLALENQKLPDMVEERLIPMRKEISLATAESARRLKERMERDYLHMKAQLDEVQKMWQQRMQETGPYAGGDFSGSKGRGSGSP